MDIKKLIINCIVKNKEILFLFSIFKYETNNEPITPPIGRGAIKKRFEEKYSTTPVWAINK
ncbi:MAG: hypothetical protein U5K55_10290 [Aliarcobacter sp.]|nr:hypothetical protein [Aliarcobacter sp.]